MRNGLESLRKESKMSQFQLARKLNITPQSIHNWETGKSKPNAEAIYKMSKILGTSTDNIFLALNTTKVVKE